MRRTAYALLASVLCSFSVGAQELDALWPSVGSQQGIPFNLISAANSFAGGASSIAVTLPIAPANSVVIVGVYEYNGGGAPVTTSSVASANLTFTKIKEYTFGSAPGQAVSLWLAPSAAGVSSEVITATLSASNQYTVAYVFALTGTYSITSPFDNNPNLPANANNGSAVSVTTSQKRDLVVWFSQGAAVCTSGTSTSNQPPSGFSTINNGCLSTNTVDGAMGYLVVDHTLSAASYTATNASAVMEEMVIAITADPALFGGAGSVMRAPLTHW